jgi:nucleolar protein 4
LRYARITLDPATGRSRGTGFACFWNLEDADKAVQQSDILRAETTGHSTVVSLHLSLFPFSELTRPYTAQEKSSILTPDPSSSLAQSLVLHGRTLDVVRAVTRDVAGKLKEDNEQMREKPDKRNLYLLREGGKNFFLKILF